MAVDSAQVTSTITVTSTLETNLDSLNANNRKVIYDARNYSAQLGATTTPKVTKHAHLKKAMSSGAATLDLTSLTGAGDNGTTVDLTGLKVQVAYFEAPASNANPVTIEPGASNGYELLGSDFKITLQPGQKAGPFWLNNAAPTVGSSAKNLDITGTGSQHLYVTLLGGVNS